MERKQDKFGHQSVYLLPYSIGFSNGLSEDYDGGTYSSPTLAAFVDAIVAQECQIKPSRLKRRVLRVVKEAPCDSIILEQLPQDQETVGMPAIERG